MNKQEAIKKIDKTLSLPRSIGSFPYDYDDGLRYAKHIINQIDEPEKPVVPQFIADKIEYCKKIDGYRLFNAMDYCYSFKKCAEWLESNEKNFALAWIFGYEVEKEKLYTAKLKLITISYVNYINKRSEDGAIVLSDLNAASGNYQTSFSRSELEELGIWDNPAFEIKEATNE